MLVSPPFSLSGIIIKNIYSNSFVGTVGASLAAIVAIDTLNPSLVISAGNQYYNLQLSIQLSMETKELLEDSLVILQKCDSMTLLDSLFNH